MENRKQPKGLITWNHRLFFYQETVWRDAGYADRTGTDFI